MHKFQVYFSATAHFTQMPKIQACFSAAAHFTQMPKFQVYLSYYANIEHVAFLDFKKRPGQLPLKT